jgi:uracil-DNA glycosylase
MAKKRKQYIAHVSKARSSRAVMRDLAIGFVANRDRLELINVKSNRIEKCGPSIDAAMSKIRHKWIVYLGSMGRTELGKAYIKLEEVRVANEVFKHEISEQVGKIHKALTDSIPSKQLSNVGWIATPTGHELSEKHLGELFDLMGCWDNLAGWQKDVIAESDKLKDEQ